MHTDSSSTQTDTFLLTKHAQIRMNARRISLEAIEAAITFGRAIYIRGAKYFVLGRNEVRDYGSVNAVIRRFEGLHVVCTGRFIVTVFRNHDFSSLRKRIRARRAR